MTDEYKFETLALHAGYEVEKTTKSRAVPVYRTSSYNFDDTQHAADLFAGSKEGNIYSRIMNPTQDVLEKRIAAVENAPASLAFASGTSAIFSAIINICSQGDEIVSSTYLYGGTYTMLKDILPRFGIKTIFVDIKKPDEVEKAITKKTRVIYFEAIGNPTLDVPDIEAIVAISKKHHIPTILDSTFATPYLLQASKWGVNIIAHSLTKWIGGHGTGIGGVVVDTGQFDWTDKKFDLYNTPDDSYHGIRFAHDLGDENPLAFIKRLRLVPIRNLGPCISPDNAWMFIQGLETLPLRMRQHSVNAVMVAEFLAEHPHVEWVRYPGLTSDPDHQVARKYFKRGFGGMIVFGIKGGRSAGEKFINNLKLISHLANVGDAKSLAIHPASTTHSQLNEKAQNQSGLKPELIRLSVGIEHIEDILTDIKKALEKSQRS